MKLFYQRLNQPRIVFAPADGTGGGEGAPAGDAADGPPDDGGDPPPAGAEDAPPAPSSILDFADKSETKPDGEPASDWKLPDGMEIPDHLVGLSAEDTLKKLSTAYKGARQQLSTRNKNEGILEGSVPKDIEGYEFTGDVENDPILKDLTSEESKPIVDEWRKAAMEVGIPDSAFAAFMQKGMKNMAENGFGITADPEQQQAINGEAEMASLTEQLGKAGADQALRQLDTFAQKLANNGILTSQEEVQEFGQMVGTARAAQIMQRIITAEFGERAIPQADGVQGAPTLAEAYEQHTAALSMPKGADRDEAVRRAEARLSQAMSGQSTNGQLKSRVL